MNRMLLLANLANGAAIAAGLSFPVVDTGQATCFDNRSDPMVGDPAGFPHGRGPQGDVIRIYNYVRLVRTVAPASAAPGS
jgi:hypothetical protein